MLANSITSLFRFPNQPTDKFGKVFRQQVEDKLSEPNNAELGKRNIETMESLVEQLKADGEYIGDSAPLDVEEEIKPQPKKTKKVK